MSTLSQAFQAVIRDIYGTGYVAHNFKASNPYFEHFVEAEIFLYEIIHFLDVRYDLAT